MIICIRFLLAHVRSHDGAQDQENSPMCPDPFHRERLGSGNETRRYTAWRRRTCNTDSVSIPCKIRTVHVNSVACTMLAWLQHSVSVLSACATRTQYSPFSHTKFTRSPSKLSFGTGSTRLRLLHGDRTSHAHNHDLCKGGAQDAAQMQPRERMQLHQPTHGTLLTHTSPPRPFFGFFFFF